MVPHPVCLIRGLWRSVETTIKSGFRDFTPVSGHNYVDLDGTPKNVLVRECETCGEISICWTFHEFKK